MKQFDRTTMLLGEDAVKKLQNSHVAVFGLGGVGGYVVEALARAGVGTLTLVDDDVVDETNLNRQLFALHSTVGKNKTDVAAARVADINPNAKVIPLCCRFDSENVHRFDFSTYDYVVDAIDTVTSKLLLAEICTNSGTPVISCMGTGNKLDPTAFCVADVFQTSVCPLAKVMRKELKARGVTKLKVVYSTEQPSSVTTEQSGRHSPASVSFVPPVAGMILASEVVKDLISK